MPGPHPGSPSASGTPGWRGRSSSAMAWPMACTCCLLGPGARPPAPGRTAGTPQSAGRGHGGAASPSRAGRASAAEGPAGSLGEAGAGPPGLGPTVSDWSDEGRRRAGWAWPGRPLLPVKAAGAPAVAASRGPGGLLVFIILGIKNKEGRMITTRRRAAPLGLDTAPAGKVTSFPRPATPLPSLASACSPSTRGKYLLPRPPGCLGQAPQGRQVSMNPRGPQAPFLSQAQRHSRTWSQRQHVNPWAHFLSLQLSFSKQR